MIDTFFIGQVVYLGTICPAVGFLHDDGKSIHFKLDFRFGTHAMASNRKERYLAKDANTFYFCGGTVLEKTEEGYVLKSESEIGFKQKPK